MRLNVLNRKLHYWLSFIVALPVLVILASGLLLQLKKQWDWVQPPEQRGSATKPKLTLEEVLTSLHGQPEMGGVTWDDVNRIDVRPSKGIAKVWLNSGWEAQVDLATGDVLQMAYRRSDLIESIHDGSFFAGDWSKLGLFLPSGLVLLFLWASGLWMFWQPIAARRRQRKMREALASNQPR